MSCGKNEMTKEKYSNEDLQTDVNWLVEQGVNEAEAEPFIMGLLNREWVNLPTPTKEIKLKDQLKDLIKEYDSSEGGIITEEIYKKITYSPEEIKVEIKKLLEDGVIYEPNPNKLRWLG